jgi:hypothetical protein
MGQEIAFLADHILDDLRMIPRAYVLLDRIAANADGCLLARENLPPALACAWDSLMRSAIAFCERLAARFHGEVVEGDFDGLDLRDVVFDDADIERIKVFAYDSAHADFAAEALDIVRQCRHIQVLLQTEELRAAA